MLEIRNATPEDLEILKKMYLTEVEDHQERADAFADILFFDSVQGISHYRGSISS